MFLVIYNNVPFSCKDFTIAQAFLLKCIEEESVIDDWSEDRYEVEHLDELKKIWCSKDGTLCYYHLSIITEVPNNIYTLCKSFPY